MPELTPSAVKQLGDAGITPQAWASARFGTPEWHGDTCGCDDDRCVGYHHDQNEPCGCLPALISDWERDNAAAAAWRFYFEAADSGDPAVQRLALDAVSGWAARFFPNALAVSLETPVNGRRGIAIAYPIGVHPVPPWAERRDSETYWMLAWSAHDESPSSTP